MQAIDIYGQKQEIKKFNVKEMKEMLNNPKIKEVRVFNVKRGDIVDIFGKQYKVLSISKSGNLHLKEIIEARPSAHE
jgi:hypothetical protein